MILNHFDFILNKPFFTGLQLYFNPIKYHLIYALLGSIEKWTLSNIIWFIVLKVVRTTIQSVLPKSKKKTWKTKFGNAEFESRKTWFSLLCHFSMITRICLLFVFKSTDKCIISNVLCPHYCINTKNCVTFFYFSF